MVIWFIAGRTIHLLAALVYAWVHYIMLGLTLRLDYNYAPTPAGYQMLWVLGGVIVATAVGVLVGLPAEARRIRQQTQDLVFFGTGGVGFMVCVTVFAEKSGGIPVGLGMALILALTVVTFVTTTRLAIRRYHGWT